MIRTVWISFSSFPSPQEENVVPPPGICPLLEAFPLTGQRSSGTVTPGGELAAGDGKTGGYGSPFPAFCPWRTGGTRRLKEKMKARKRIFRRFSGIGRVRKEGYRLSLGAAARENADPSKPLGKTFFQGIPLEEAERRKKKWKFR